jgi:uncharacterized protein (UPF0333 family)
MRKRFILYEAHKHEVPGKGEIMKRWTNKIKNKQYGQAMVEFALTLPIFLLAVIGVIELSRFFLVYSSVYTASREAARYGSSVGDGGVTHYMDCDGIRQVAIDTGFFGGVNHIEDEPTPKIDIFFESSPGTKIGKCEDLVEEKNIILGTRLLVDISVKYEPLLTGFVLPDGITVSATNGRTIMKEIVLETTPLPVPLCSDDVKFLGTITNEPNNKTYTVNIKNLSTTAIYQLTAAKIVGFNEKKDINKIYWNNTMIWENKTGTEFPIIDPDSWEEVYDINGNLIFSRLLSSEQTIPIKFEFLKVINKSQLALKFDLTFQNTSRLSQFCTLKWP